MGLIEKGGSLVLSAFLAVTGSGGTAVAENNGEIIDPSLKTPDPIVAKGEMSSQKGIVLENQKEIEINQELSEFFAGEGEYSDEKLQKRVFYSFGLEKAGFGFCGINGVETVVQGLLLGHFSKNDKDYVVIGTKNKENEKAVFLAQWPIDETMKAYNDVAVIEMVGVSSSTRYSVKSLSTRDEVNSFMRERIGDVVLFNFYNITDKDLKSNGFKSLDEKKSNFYLNIVVPRIDGNTEFVAGLLMPTKDNQKGMGLDEVNYIKSLPKGEKTNSIKSFSDMEIVLDNSSETLPLLSYITYNKYIH